MEDIRDVIGDLQRQSGYTLAGAFPFGDSEALADELLAFVERGTKRATAGALAEYEAEKEPLPQPGTYYGLLDGRGCGRFVMEITEVRIGRLDSVDAAFAWDEGEYDRTRESWLENHRRCFSRQGVADTDALPVVFERFRVVWPVEDEPRWLTGIVREVTVADRRWISRSVRSPDGPADPARLPALLAARYGEPDGLLTFRPRPDGVCDVVSIDVFNDEPSTRACLLEALDVLVRQERWSTLRMPR